MVAQSPAVGITVFAFARRCLFAACITLCAIADSGFAVHAQTYLRPDTPRRGIDDRIRLDIDLLYGAYDTTIRLDDVNGATSTPGTVISGEDDLGLADVQLLPLVELTLVPSPHHLVRLNGLSMRRNASTILTRDISWDEADYFAGERVDSHLDITMVGISYGYIPFRADRYELGLNFGLEFTSVNANAEVLTRVVREEESAAGVFPLIGLEGRFDVTRRLSVAARWQYLSVGWFESLGVDINNVDATVVDGRFDIRWRQNQHLSYGLGYRYFNIDVNAPESDPRGIVTIGLTGPMLFVQGSL